MAKTIDELNDLTYRGFTIQIRFQWIGYFALCFDGVDEMFVVNRVFEKKRSAVIAAKRQIDWVIVGRGESKEKKKKTTKTQRKVA